ncbi:MAG TPA: peroxide stress protein YaaA [Candidatus Merdenecus merdavium]|nr:peroxide stress protein YaaA [Candidatus Merdenecus merdavium]
MITIISPAKNMDPKRSKTPPKTIPVFMEKTQEIVAKLRTYSPFDLQELMKINEKLSVDSMERYRVMCFDHKGTSAIETYDGIQYKYMNIHNLTEEEKEFTQEHIRILSGAYGVVKPYDSIYEYRLEMLTKLPLRDKKNLYDYWGKDLYEELFKNQDVIINLASNEYSKCIQKYLQPQDTFITCIFKVMNKGSYKVLATAAKMARGRMVEYIVKNQIHDPQQVKEFKEDGFYFDPSLSTDKEFVFLKG